MRLPEVFYHQETVSLARALLGTFLVHRTPDGQAVGRVVETEAYLHDDPACHAFRGKTRRNAVMFGAPGYAYIYLIYGMYYCLNVTSGAEGTGEAVLIRALEPVAGLELMHRRRGVEEIRQLCSGPGKLAIAMGIRPEQNGVSLRAGALTLHSSGSFRASVMLQPSEIVATPRIGINEAAALPLRFYIKGCAYASRPCLLTKRKKAPV